MSVPENRIVSDLWPCHDGWAASVSFITQGQSNDALDLAARKQWAAKFKASWYRSSRTKEAAQAKLQRKLEIARSILPGVPVVFNAETE